MCPVARIQYYSLRDGPSSPCWWDSTSWVFSRSLWVVGSGYHTAPPNLRLCFPYIHTCTIQTILVTYGEAGFHVEGAGFNGTSMFVQYELRKGRKAEHTAHHTVPPNSRSATCSRLVRILTGNFRSGKRQATVLIMIAHLQVLWW